METTLSMIRRIQTAYHLQRIRKKDGEHTEENNTNDLYNLQRKRRNKAGKHFILNIADQEPTGKVVYEHLYVCLSEREKLEDVDFQNTGMEKHTKHMMRRRQKGGQPSNIKFC